MKNFITIREIKEGLASGKFSKKDVIEFYQKRFAEIDPQVQSALEVFTTDSILEESQNGGLLDASGLIKDNICQKGRITSCASKMLENFRSTYDATIIERIKEQGGLLMGRANLDEFAMGSSTETSAFMKTTNPWDKSRVPGGSSGGSAAAVSAGLVPWALGSETGGSVRHPAAFCGIVGLKPTYGSLSRYGLVAYASSLDQIGVFSHTVWDNALVYSALAGHDPRDASSLKLEKKDYTKALDGKLPSSIRVGVVKTALEAEGLDPEVKALVEQGVQSLKSAGAEIKEISLPTLDYAAACYFIISRAEAASNLARFDGIRYGYRHAGAKDLQELYEKSRSEGFGKEVKVRMLIGNYVLSAGYAGKFYHNAQKVQQLIREDFNKAFKDVDILVMPSQSAPAFKLGAFDNDKLQMDLQDYFTAPVNLAGIPAMSVPCGFTKSNMPIGMQLIGPHLSEQLLFQVGDAYQQITDWHKKHPKL